MENLKLSMIQTDLVWHDGVANRKKFESHFSKVGQQDLVLLPEMFTSGFTMEVESQGEIHPGESLAWMQEMSSRYQFAIGGSLITKENNNWYNRFYCVEGTQILAQYDKRHLFRMAEEDKVFVAGKSTQIFEYKSWKINPLICYDLRFPVWSRNTQSNPYDLALYVANWPAARVSHWTQLLKARAIENQVFVAGVNRIGIDGKGIEYSGQSGMIDYLGEVMQEGGNAESILSAVLESEKLAAYREKFPAWKDADEFKIQSGFES